MPGGRPRLGRAHFRKPNVWRIDTGDLLLTTPRKQAEDSDISYQNDWEARNPQDSGCIESYDEPKISDEMVIPVMIPREA